jgi:hypothetical protein
MGDDMRTVQALAANRGVLLLVGAIGLMAVAAAIAISMLSDVQPGFGLPSVEPSAAEVSGTTEPSASPTSAVSATPEPTRVPTPTPRPSGPAAVAWAPGDAREGRAAAIVRSGDRWIVGGSVRVGDFSRAAIWTSPDGRTWSEPIALPPEPVPNSDGMHPRYWINGFGQWDGTLLAFGWNGVGCCDGGYPMLWRSDDGDAWSVVDTAGSAFGDGYHFPQRSVVTPQGELAVLSATGLGSDASIFVTGDLMAWDERPITDGERPMSVAGLAASASLLMIVGTEHHPYEADEDPPTTAHAWTSTDGRTWTPVVAPNPEGTLDDVTWDPSRERFVAIGTTDDGRPAAWLTTDGSQWSSVPLAEEAGRMHDLVAVDGLVVASGTVGPRLDDTTGGTIAWSSHDGITWRVVPLVDRQWSSLVGATPGFALMVVNRWEEAGGDSWQSWAGPVGE